MEEVSERPIAASRLPLFVGGAVGVIGILLQTPWLSLNDVREALGIIWRPILTITSIMIITGAAGRLGVLERVAGNLFPLARGSSHRLFAMAFGLSAGASAVLNNDSAVLLLIPIVVPLVRRLYPDRPDMVTPFALTVFMAAGVAPVVVSNPMNMIVAAYAGIDFNSYAFHMVPVALAGWVVAFLVLRGLFHRKLASAAPAEQPSSGSAGWSKAQLSALILLLGILAAYPIVSYLGGPIFAVAGAGAVLSLALCAAHSAGSPLDIAKSDVSWATLFLLPTLFVFAVGMSNHGLVSFLQDIYADGGPGVISIVSGIGSALINNHPMALLNIAALDPGPGKDIKPVLAALIGGDLGPRLLPWGSLAGLLWFSSLRRLGVAISPLQFCAVGLALTVPSMAICLFVLSLYG